MQPAGRNCAACVAAAMKHWQWRAGWSACHKSSEADRVEAPQPTSPSNSRLARRALIRGTALLPLAGMVGGSRPAVAEPETDTPFEAGMVRRIARELAQKPFQAPDTKLPSYLASLDYDQFRS